ncbi:MAG: hypothetical protein IKD69_09870 [Solobacterium sp.]|nr:hypothetical protein [Solobacterium sp.]
MDACGTVFSVASKIREDNCRKDCRKDSHFDQNCRDIHIHVPFFESDTLSVFISSSLPQEGLLPAMQAAACQEFPFLTVSRSKQFSPAGSVSSCRFSGGIDHTGKDFPLHFPVCGFQNRLQIHAASADADGKMTNSFSSWLLMLKPYFLPSITCSASG